MRNNLITLSILLAAAFTFAAATANAQTSECPNGMVCLTRAAAVAALEAQDKAKALEAEVKAKDQAIEDYKKLVADVKLELARTAGEKSQLEADRVRWSSIVDILIKNSRRKSIGLINF